MVKSKKVNKTVKSIKTAKVNKSAKNQSEGTIRISRSDFARLNGKTINAIRHQIENGKCAYTFKKVGKEYYAEIPERAYKQLERNAKNERENGNWIPSRDELFAQLKRYIAKSELVISKLEALLKESSPVTR